MGPRVPSFNRNINKLAKLTPAYEKSAAAKGHPRRNLSNLQQLTHNNSITTLRKNHSETSLKKNRSSGQLTKLTRPHSSKGALKTRRTSSGKKRNSAQNIQAPEGPANPTVRFDLGDEEDGEEEEVDGDDGWVDSASHSASTTRSNTRRNSMINAQDAIKKGMKSKDAEPNGVDEQSTVQADAALNKADRHNASSKSSPTLSRASTLQSSQALDADRITSKLLSRNTSFTAAPKVSSVLAGTKTVPPSQTSTLLDSPGKPRLVSRFVEPTKSENGTPQESSLLPHHTQERLSSSEETDASPSNSFHTEEKQLSQKGRLHSDAATLNAGQLPSSRTQQKLWLERQSANMQSQHMQPPVGLLRSNRLSSASLPYAAAATNGDGRLTPQMRQLFEQSDNEYRRVRMFQNPLADAIKRLQDAGELSLGAHDAKSSDSRQTQANGKQLSKLNQSQTMPSYRSSKAGASEADLRRPKVAFQGLKGSKDDSSSVAERNTVEDDVDREAARLRKAEAREICRRMWDLSMVSNE